MSKPFADIGCCIYCGAQSYTPDGGGKLSKEHIVPYALNGDLVISNASCKACASITGQFEALVLKNHLRGSRVAMGLQSRKRRKAESLPLFIPDEDGDRKIMVPVKDFPTALFLPVLPDPPAAWELEGHGHVAYDLQPFLHLFVDQSTIAQRLGVQSWAYGSMDTRAFCRMIGKIAHAYAVATLGKDAFEPLLPDFIRDPNLESRDILPFIGGCRPEPPQPGLLHRLECVTSRIGGQKVHVVLVRLFAILGAPTYCALVGTPKGEAFPQLGSNPGGVDKLWNFYRILRTP